MSRSLPPEPIHFYLPSEIQIKQIRQADPDKDWALFNNGVRVWIGQTFLRLQKAGYPVELSSRVPKKGILFTHADYIPHVMSKKPLFSPLVIVAARADRPHQPYADFEVVQNRHSSNGKNVFHIDHWPQPGLIARSAERGTTVSNIVYKGMAGEMADDFNAAPWLDFVAQHDMRWQCDATTWKGNETGAYQDVRWNDYSEADVIVAIRKNGASLYPKKPASKLINAWAAGVPAILGGEHAYRELRKSELDYIEASSAAEVQRALLALRENPELYRAMVDNGLKRTEDFTAAQITQQWAKVMFEQIQGCATVRNPSLFGRSNVKALKFRVVSFVKGGWIDEQEEQLELTG